ncbi:MAG: hypothetical protein ACR650_11285 [Methylocystis sp.]
MKKFPYVGYDGTRAGRPSIRTTAEPPPGFSLHDDLMGSLDASGWYREIAGRLRREGIAQHYRADELARLKEDFCVAPVDDPFEMDKLMCRKEPVAVVRNETDLRVATFNGRLVIEIDTDVHEEVLLRSIKTVISSCGAHPPRRKQFGAWVEHRILAFLDLLLLGYAPEKDRKQMAQWLFPEINDVEERGKKFDRAGGYLRDAIACLRSLRAYPR